jgi:hypothetical protein
MSEIRSNLINCLQKRFPRSPLLDTITSINYQDDGGIAGVVHFMIVYDTYSGSKHRALGMLNFGSVVDARTIASVSDSSFSSLDKNQILYVDNSIKRTSSPISSEDLTLSKNIIVYTNKLSVSHDSIIESFENFGLSVDIIEEYEMFQTVFISYGGPDENMATRINEYLNSKGIRTWFFPRDAMPGAKLHRVMHEGVNKYDRVLFICSKSSLSRSGVKNELERVLEREAKEGGSDILVPVTLDDYVYSDWMPDRTDLADQIRSRVITKINTDTDDLFQKSMEIVHRVFYKT